MKKNHKAKHSFQERQMGGMKRVLVFTLTAGLLVSSLSGCKKTVNPGQTETPKETMTQSVTQDSSQGTTEKETEKETEGPVSSFPFTRENFPRLDGSTSLAPLAKAVAAKLLNESEESVSDLINFNKTTQSYRNLMNGECSFLIASEPNLVVFDEMKEKGFEVEMEAISTEALIFVVNENNPVNSLTTEQIRKIYTGEITNWKEVGGDDLKIDAFQRNKGAGSQALMEKLVMGDIPMMEAPETYVSTSMGDLMTAVKSYDNSASAIGYSVYYYANDMKMADGLKIIAVDGVDPNDDTIRSGEYPHRNAYYCVIDKAATADSPERALYDFMVSAQGQKIVASQGYVSITAPEEIEAIESTKDRENKYTRLRASYIEAPVASDSYGAVYPFRGSVAYTSSDDGYSYQAGATYGLMDRNGQIICDAVYDELYVPGYYDYENGKYTYLPYWLLGKTKAVESGIEGMDPYAEVDYTVVSFDGSYVSEKSYSYFIASENGLWLAEDYNTNDIIILDLDGNVVGTKDSFSFENAIPEGYKVNYMGMASYSKPYLAEVYNDDYVNNEYYYVGEDGKFAAGPYDIAQGFKDGVAIVGKSYVDCTGANSYLYGLIDESFNYIIEPKYKDISGFRNGTAAAAYAPEDNHVEAGDVYDIIDTKGNVLCTVNYSNIYHVGDLYECTALFMDDDTVLMDEKGKEILRYSPNGQTSVFQYQPIVVVDDGTVCTVTNYETGKSIEIEATYVNELYVGVDFEGVQDGGAWFQTFQTTNELTYDGIYSIFDTDLNLLYQGTEDNYIGLYYDQVSNEQYFMESYNGTNKVKLMDTSFKEIGTYYGDVKKYGDMIRVNDDYSTSYYDLSGNLIFRYNMVSSFDD